MPNIILSQGKKKLPKYFWDLRQKLIDKYLAQDLLLFFFFNLNIRKFLWVYKRPKLRTLIGDKKSKIFFGEHTYAIPFFQPVLTPRTIFNSWTR